TSAATFTAGTSTVALDGGTQTVSGSTTFYNLSKTVTAAATMTFAATATQTVSNALTLQGAASNLLTLGSSLNGVQWKIDPQGTRTISYVSVSDSNNTNATAIDCTASNCTDGGRNTNWSFPSSSSSASDTGHHKPNKFPNGGRKGGQERPSGAADSGQFEGAAEDGQPQVFPPADLPKAREEEGEIVVPMARVTPAQRERLSRERRLARGAETVQREPTSLTFGELRGPGILEGLRRLRRLALSRMGEGMRRVIPPETMRHIEPSEGIVETPKTFVAARMRVWLLSLLRDMPFGPGRLLGQGGEKLARSLAALPRTERGDRLIAGVFSLQIPLGILALFEGGRSSPLSALLARRIGERVDRSLVALFGSQYLAFQQGFGGKQRNINETVTRIVARSGKVFRDEWMALERDLRSLMGRETARRAAPESERYYTTELRKKGRELVLSTFRIAIIGPRDIPYAFIPVTLSS
ncbi:MAG: hypothetical protein AAB853_01110, partial [Patescibacteria group bacterium]